MSTNKNFGIPKTLFGHGKKGKHHASLLYRPQIMLSQKCMKLILVTTFIKLGFADTRDAIEILEKFSPHNLEKEVLKTLHDIALWVEKSNVVNRCNH